MNLSAPPSQARQEPSVDIGLTAYRRATYLREAIESVLAQTFEAWQLVICDNGPGGGEIQRTVEPYLADGRISYRPTGEVLSLAANWTNALNGGRAPYAAILNDDDRYHPEHLERRVDALERHPECGFAFAEWVQIDEDGNELLRATPKFAVGVVERAVLASWFTRQNLVTPPSIVVRRSACLAVGAYFDERWHYCDWEFWARLGARYPAYYLGRPDCDYRRHPTANTFLAQAGADQVLAMVQTIEDRFLREVPGFSLSRRDRARNRSEILLHSAGDLHRAGGFKVARPLYLRALKTYPPTARRRASLAMLSRSLLGERGTRAISRILGLLDRRAAAR